MMEAEGPLARVERTLWTVWAFISEAVNRLIRPEPPAGVGSEHNASQESAGEGEPPDCGGGVSPTGEDPSVTVTLPDSPRAVDVEQVVAEDNFQLHEAAEKNPDQTRQDDSGLLVTEDAKDNGKEETRSSPLQSCHETTEDDKHRGHVESKTLTGDVISEKIQTNEEEAVCDASVVTTEDLQETSTVVQLKSEDGDEARPEHDQKCETADSEGDQGTMTNFRPEEHGVTLQEHRPRESGGGASTQEEAGSRIIVLKVDQKMEADEEAARGNNQLVSHRDLTDVVGGEKREVVMSPRSENDEAVRSFDNRGEGAVTEEESEDTNWTTRENSQETFQTLEEDNQEEDISFEHLAGSDATVPGEKSQHTGDSRVIPENQDFLKMIQTTTTTMERPEGETRREMSRELGSIPLGRREGRVVMFEELNTPACEETQDGLPENNNELGQDENTTRRFLEVGDYKEAQSAQLPHEVGSSEQESPQNINAACLPMSEFVEENQGSTGDPKTIVDLAEVERSRIPPHPNVDLLQETTGKLFEEATQDFVRPLKTESSEGPMKKEIRDLRTPDGTEHRLFGFGIDGALSSSEDAVGNGHGTKGAPLEESAKFTDETLKAEAPEMTQELLHTTECSNSSLENIPTPGWWTYSTESGTEAQRDGTVNKLDTKNNMEGVCKREPLEAEHEMRGITETEPLAPMESDLITGSEEEENVKHDVLSTQSETAEIQNQFPPKTFDIEMEKVISGIEAADDITVTFAGMSTGRSAKHENESPRCHAEGWSSSTSSHPDKIDEEILDLWIETAMSASSQPNSQEDSVEIETQNLLNQASVAETGSGCGSEINTPLMYQNSRTTQGEEEKMEPPLGNLDGEANETTGTPTEGSDAMMSSFSPDVLTELTTSLPSDEVTQSVLGQSQSGLWSSSEERRVLRERSSESQKEELEILSKEEQKSGDTDENSPSRSDAAFDHDDHTEVGAPGLDFTPQRSRISLKNPRVRPPTNPRYLLNMPSREPTLSSPSKPPAGLPSGGLSIGIKLPGLAAGFPLLKKTQQVMKDDDEQETSSQEAEIKPEEKGDHPGKEETPHKPKWMPPKHPGFGNPLMSELKTKLKKTSNE